VFKVARKHKHVGIINVAANRLLVQHANLAASERLQRASELLVLDVGHGLDILERKLVLIIKQ